MEMTLMGRDVNLSRRDSGASNWLVGCGIALAVVIVVIAVAGFVGYRFVSKGMDAGKQQLAQEFSKQYAKWQEQKKIPEAQKQNFADLAEVVQRPDTSIWVISLAMATASSAMEGSTISDDQAKTLTDVAAFVKGNPKAGLIDFSNFFKTHPEAQRAFQELQSRHGGGAPAPAPVSPAAPKPEAPAPAK